MQPFPRAESRVHCAQRERTQTLTMSSTEYPCPVPRLYTTCVKPPSAQPRGLVPRAGAGAARAGTPARWAAGGAAQGHGAARTSPLSDSSFFTAATCPLARSMTCM